MLKAALTPTGWHCKVKLGQESLPLLPSASLEDLGTLYPSCAQAPYNIPPLHTFNRFSLFFLINNEDFSVPATAIIEGTTTHGGAFASSELPIEHIAGKRPIIHYLAAKALMNDFVTGRSWLHSQQYKEYQVNNAEQFQQAVQQQAETLGQRWATTGKWTSFIAVDKDSQIRNQMSIYKPQPIETPDIDLTRPRLRYRSLERPERRREVGQGGFGQPGFGQRVFGQNGFGQPGFGKVVFESANSELSTEVGLDLKQPSELHVKKMDVRSIPPGESIPYRCENPVKDSVEATRVKTVSGFSELGGFVSYCPEETFTVEEQLFQQPQGRVTPDGSFDFSSHLPVLLSVLVAFEHDVYEKLVDKIVNTEPATVGVSALYPVLGTTVGESKEHYYFADTQRLFSISFASASPEIPATSSPTTSNKYSPFFLDTVLVVAYIQTRYPESADLWELLVRKARTWVDVTLRYFVSYFDMVSSVPDTSGLQETAAASLLVDKNITAQKPEARGRIKAGYFSEDNYSQEEKHSPA
ncbi:hypothetical protein AJ79_06135 [Helicocarpus griseus UAMH5409]|uniref:Uncharacterized protein n=1 Tax=Helicocarpus griseus UAMH5409 TaxID=1447875 RepID=A0A2B7XGZ0_9EURO|nr:hypothetical protein AJ79_06135 [Helicocarpus griseus UAMH5409]